MKKVSVIAAVLLWFGATAQAEVIQPIQAVSIPLGDVTGVAYYTVQPDGYRVVVTLAAGQETTPIRVVSILTSGQKMVVSTPGPVGSEAKEIEITRVGEELIVRKSELFLATAQ